ncbi:MAG: TonB-dependent receptor [Bacteroidota bacterium]
MKLINHLTLLLGLLFLFSSQSVWASTESAQQPLPDVLDQIEEKYQVFFSYDAELLSEIIVNFELRDKEQLEGAVNRALYDTGLKYKNLEGRYYVVYRDTKAERRTVRKINRKFKQINRLEESSKVSLQQRSQDRQIQALSVFQSVKELTSVKAISGQVVDTDGNPLIGANVIVKGTSTGTVTDLDGNYEINAPDDATLIFSYTGFVSKEVEVSGLSTVDVVLESDTEVLGEVVVVGYGQQRKGAVTGSVASISSEEITALPVPNLTEAFQGRLPGVQVINNGGPGEAPIVRIRGIGSISFAPNPLYVVDGYPVGGLNDFDNNDIESISVLKDASAAAIYGSRAANGVVLVTTKKGRASDGLRVNYNGYVGAAQPWNQLDLLNREQYLDYGRQLLDNAGDTYPDRWAQLDQPIFEGANQTYNETDVDYQDAVFRTGLNTNHSLSLTGGNENANFYTSFGYFQQEGIMLGTDYERLNLRLNSDYKVGKRIKIGQTLTVVGGARENEQNGGGRSQLQNIIRGIPYIPIEDPTLPGGYRAPDNSDGSDPENPVRVAIFDRNFDRNARIFGTAYAGIEIFEGLEYRFTSGLDWNYNRNRNILPIYFDGFSGRDFLELSDTRGNFIGTYLSNQLNYRTTVGGHSIDLLGIAERQDSRSNFLSGSGQRATNDLTVLNGASNPQVNSGEGENTIFSFAGRLNYDYLGRYLLSASIRRDGSSKFAEGNKFGTFPGLSLGWMISEEPFMSNVNNLSRLKIRGSWGQVGFEGIGNYESQAGIVNNTAAIFGDAAIQGAFFNKLPNQDLEWEVTTMINIGVDLGILNDRIQFSADWYERVTDNLILAVPQPPSQGYSQSTIANVGGMENWGLDFQVTYYSDRNKVFNWDVSANLSIYRNEVTSLATENAALFGGSSGDFGGFDITRTAVGDPIQSFFGWEVEGIFQDQAQIDQFNARGDADTPYQAQAAPGDLIFRDLDGDGTITSDDRTVIGSFIPDFTYGFNINAEFKNVYMQMFWNGVQGNDIYNGTKVLTEGGLRLFNAGTAVLDAWTPNNTDTDVPRMVNGDPNQNTRTSDRFIEDGSFLRLQNLRIGYRIPESLLEKSGFIRNLNIYVSGANLLTFTNYSGYDPEIGSRFNNLLTVGIDYGQYPRPRTLLFGIQAGF